MQNLQQHAITGDNIQLGYHTVNALLIETYYTSIGSDEYYVSTPSPLHIQSPLYFSPPKITKQHSVQIETETDIGTCQRRETQSGGGGGGGCLSYFPSSPLCEIRSEVTGGGWMRIRQPNPSFLCHLYFQR